MSCRLARGPGPRLGVWAGGRQIRVGTNPAMHWRDNGGSLPQGPRVSGVERGMVRNFL